MGTLAEHDIPPYPRPLQRSQGTSADPPLIFPPGHSKLWCICSESPALGKKDVDCEATTAAWFHRQEEKSYTRAG